MDLWGLHNERHVRRPFVHHLFIHPTAITHHVAMVGEEEDDCIVRQAAYLKCSQEDADIVVHVRGGCIVHRRNRLHYFRIVDHVGPFLGAARISAQPANFGRNRTAAGWIPDRT